MARRNVIDGGVTRRERSGRLSRQSQGLICAGKWKLCPRRSRSSQGLSRICANFLLRAWGVDDAAKFRGVFSGNLGQERDLRREVFASVTEEARRRMAVRQARREMFVEFTYVVAEREERRDRWRQMEGEMILEARRRRVRRFTQEKQAQQAQQREADRRRREAFAAEEQQRRLAAEDLR